MNKLEKKGKDSLTFKFLKLLTSIAIHKPKFIFLGDKIKEASLILTNHVGSRAPLTIELYADFPTRLLGTYEMNGSLKEVYRYLSTTYYHQKKKWNKYAAKMFSFIACPFVYGYYRGLKLISVYKDLRFVNTIKESFTCLKDFKESIVIFPEDSSNGYFETLTHFYKGFLLIADYAYKKGLDLDIFVAYLNSKTKTYVFDKPIKYSSLLTSNLTQEEIAKNFLDRCNDLGKLEFNENN